MPAVSTFGKSLQWAEVPGAEGSTEKVKGTGAEEMKAAGSSSRKCGIFKVIEAAGGFPCGRGISPQCLLSLPGQLGWLWPRAILIHDGGDGGLIGNVVG